MGTTIDGSIGVLVPAGTVTTPSITASGDQNTGIYFPAADTIAFTEGGVESLRLNSAGKLVYPANALGAASAGLFEYDGVSSYFTPTGTQRGVVPDVQTYRMNTTLALSATTSAQNILGVGVTLAGSTVYQFSALYAFIKTTTTTSHSYAIGFGGTATVNNIGYTYLRYFDTVGFNTVTATGYVGFLNTASVTTITGSTSAATFYNWLLLNGTVSINAGGTFIPQIATSASGPIYTTQIGSYFTIFPLSSSGSNTSVGAWA